LANDWMRRQPQTSTAKTRRQRTEPENQKPLNLWIDNGHGQAA
jgi:hypothetical protein